LPYKVGKGGSPAAGGNPTQNGAEMAKHAQLSTTAIYGNAIGAEEQAIAERMRR